MSNYEVITLKQEIANILSKSTLSEATISMILREASDTYSTVALQKYNQEALKRAVEEKDGNTNGNDNT